MPHSIGPEAGVCRRRDDVFLRNLDGRPFARPAVLFAGETVLCTFAITPSVVGVEIGAERVRNGAQSGQGGVHVGHTS
jgi:hypothetical protein